MSVTKLNTAVPSFANSGKLRRLARLKAAEGAATETFHGDCTGMLRLLNEALATELLCVLRYRRHHFVARGLESDRIAHEFLVHADEDLAHADLLAARIVQLGGEPDFSPEALQRSRHSEYLEGRHIFDMVRENLASEQMAIESYRGLLEYIGERDPQTRRMLEGILSVKEAHADELLDFVPAEPDPAV